MDIVQVISEELNIFPLRIASAIQLFDNDSTIAFIARYRKEVTKSLNEEELRDIKTKLDYYRNLEDKRKTVLKSLLDQKVLTKELEEQINAVRRLNDLEDIYRPYKPKRKTRASEAISRGLKPLADLFLNQEKTANLQNFISSFINEEKKIKTKEDAINGAKDIIAEIVSDDPETRKFLKTFIFNNALIQTKEIGKDEKNTFEMYKDFKERIKEIPNYRILAINRGEKLKFLKVSYFFEEEYIKEKLYKKYAFNGLYEEYIYPAIDDSLSRLAYPSVENEIFSDLFTRAEDSSIKVFEKNLYQLLMYPPLKNKIVMGFDPGFRTGCKVAVVDIYGNLLDVDTFFITSSSAEQIEKESSRILLLIKKHNVEYIALGNGTASRESEEVLSRLIKNNSLNVKISIVNESGASVYSASQLGQEEFPSLPVEKRSAISLARRLQDPLNELVKIDPKSIGVGQYQHDMNQNKLEAALKEIVAESVNAVGVNLNTSSVSILKYISGISESIAKNIYEYRLKNGPFKNRQQLLKVSKLGPKAFEQSAGFLRIREGDNPLDNTAVHPESYDIAKKILSLANFSEKDVNNKEVQEKIKELRDAGFFKKNIPNYSETTDDIIDELTKPGHDIRDEATVLELDNTVKDIKDLKVGMILNGTVHNITDFGAFVDINVHQDGLVHISQIADKYIKNPNEVLSINQLVKVKVISVDVERKKIGLSIKQVDK